MAAFSFSAWYSSLFAVSMGIFLQFNTKQSQPYMDEIFHVPQAQKYCNYKFDEWDPKITTLPGLYFISFACLRTLAFFVGHELRVVCSTFFLRMVNTLFLMGNVLLLRQILLILHCDNTRQSRQVRFSNFMNSVKYSGTFLRNHFVRYQNTYVMERGAVGSESLTRYRKLSRHIWDSMSTLRPLEWVASNFSLQ